MHELSEATRVYLAAWPPSKQREQFEGMSRIYGAVTGTHRHAAEGNMSIPALAGIDAGPRVHLAERDPQHHGLPSRGVGDRGLTLRILLSYHYYQKEDIEGLIERYFAGRAPDIFLDSGAYSAHTMGAEIHLAPYVAYIKRFAPLLSAYANLDVIGDAGATRDNQKRMEDMGLAPLPVFHFGEDFAALDWYLDHGYAYIALGGLVGKPRGAVGKFLVECFKRAKGRAVFHGFGLTSWQLLKDFRWYSVDSSSWGQGFRFGQVPVFDRVAGLFREIKLGDPVTCYRWGHLVRELGFDPADFADRKRNDRAKVCAVSALSYMMAEQWLRRRWGPVEIPGRDAPPVPAVHLADANPRRYGDATQGASGDRLHLADTSNGINFGRAAAGAGVFLADSQWAGGRDLAELGQIAQGGPGYRVHLAEGMNIGRTAGAAAAGLVSYLAAGSANDPELRDAQHAAAGLRMYLAEHSLDRGGVGDTSRAMEVLGNA